MENRRWVFFIILFILICALLNSWFQKTKVQETASITVTATESKIETVAADLEQNKRSVATTPVWRKQDPWYDQVKKSSKADQPGDEENPKGVLSLM